MRSPLAARLGLEPRQAESESAVLPLHHQAVEKRRDVVVRMGSRGAAALLRGGAGDGIRTRNRLFTKQVLYR